MTSPDRLPEMVIHGVFNKTYILAETSDELIIIDQHAAAERIKYEELMHQFYSKNLKIQRLLEPMLFELDTKKSIMLEENLKLFREMGIEIEPFGKNEFLLRTIPNVLGRQIQKEAVLDMINELEESEKIKQIDELKISKIASMACRSAVKAGEDISREEIKKYLQKLDKKEIPFTCPHGRPVMIRFTLAEIEKMFRRT